MAERETRLPAEPLECRQIAEALLLEGETEQSVAWALLAISGQLAEIIRMQRKR